MGPTDIGSLGSKAKSGKKYDFWFGIRVASMPAFATASDASLSFSGSNQAREGRLVDALAVRGDERRDTLR